MSLILSLETTTTNCSVALGLEGKLIALKEYNHKKYSHAEKLHVFIKDVLSEANYKLSDLKAIAVSKGPGSYTGLRIGVSAAKGLCFSLDLPLISIDTLSALSHQVENHNYQFIIPMLDARRMEVYTAIFNQDWQRIKPTEAKILDENSYQEYLNQGKVVFIGNSVEKFEEICQHPQATFIKSFPSAREMINLAHNKYKKNDTEDVAYFEPFYLKDFIGKK